MTSDMATTFSSAITDIDRDSLYTLPLSIIPLETSALRRARMIKNVRLDSVIEIFADANSGSGQLMVESLPHVFDWPEGSIHPDLGTMRKLAMMPSFDVYSLRILLRDHGIAVNSHDALRLSQAKNRDLTSYMATFTRPLIVNIYGEQNIAISSFEDIIGLFRNPDRKKSIENLRIMADKLEIEMEYIPRFLEDYGDIFLSFSYYRSCLDQITPIIGEFLDWLRQVQTNQVLRRDPDLLSACRIIQETLNDRLAAITGCFENFDRSARDLWQDLTPDRFAKVERLIKGHHAFIGGILCALTVKIENWDRAFPDKSSGSPARRAEYLMSEMRQGIEKIRKIQVSAPMLAELRTG
ncbi:MAG: hypothetical protein U1E66_01715 [Rhodospirillales bacterium]